MENEKYYEKHYEKHYEKQNEKHYEKHYEKRSARNCRGAFSILHSPFSTQRTLHSPFSTKEVQPVPPALPGAEKEVPDRLQAGPAGVPATGDVRFGGSGLLAETVRRELPGARVVWNDHDDFAARLAAIPRTNALIDRLRGMAAGIPRDARIPNDVRGRMLRAIADDGPGADFVTISANLLFSGNYSTDIEGLEKKAFYNLLRTDGYPPADGYLEGVERISADWRNLLAQHKGRPGTVLIADPPYLTTDASSYREGRFWRLRDHLDVIAAMDGHPYFYFTSDRSQIADLCEWIAAHGGRSPLQGATAAHSRAALNHAAGYRDIMFHKANKMKNRMKKETHGTHEGHSPLSILNSPLRKEHRLQKACAAWFALRYGNRRAGILASIPNEGKRSPANAARLKSMGLRAGMPDLLILAPGGRAMFIELKTESGRLSPEQKKAHEAIAGLGHKVRTVRTLEAFVETVAAFMETEG